MAIFKIVSKSLLWICLSVGFLLTASAAAHEFNPPGCPDPCVQILPVFDGHNIVVTDIDGAIIKSIEIDLPEGTTPDHIARMNDGFASEIQTNSGKHSVGVFIAKSGSTSGGETSHAQTQTYDIGTHLITITITFVYDAAGNLIDVNVQRTVTKKTGGPQMDK